MDKHLYTRKEAAALLSISVDTLDVLRYDGKLKSTDLEQFVTMLKEEELNC